MRALILIIGLAIAGCGGSAGASQAPATPGPTTTSVPVTPAPPTAAPTTTSNIDAIVAHTVTAIDALSAHLAAEDTDSIGTWFVDEGDWLADNVTTDDVDADPELAEYSRAMVAGLQAVLDDNDPTDAATAMVALRDELAALAPDSAPPRPTPAPTPEPVPTVPGSVGLTDGAGNEATVLVDEVGTYKRSSGGSPCDLGKCLTIRVTITCTSGEDMEWSPFDFTIVSEEGDVYEITGLYKDPSLPFDISLSDGEKVRGWLTFDVPTSLKHGFIHIGDDDGAEIEF